MQELRWKLILIAGVAALFAFLSYPPGEKIKLGLDLRGGIHLVLRVDADEAVEAEVRDDLDSFRRFLADEGIEAASVTPDGTRGGTVLLASDADRDRALQVATDNYSVYSTSRVSGDDGAPGVRFVLSATTATRYRDTAIEQALQTIRNRIDEFGVSEPIIQRQGITGDRILVQLPGVENPERVKELLRNTALLELKLVQRGPADSRELLLPDGLVPAASEVVTGTGNEGVAAHTHFYLVDRDPVITGRDLRTARMGQDEFGLPSVNFTLNAEGSRKFGEATGANVGSYLAVILDNRVQTAPIIEERIINNGQIRGGYSLEEAEDLALVLRAGALPASIRYLEERSVGPSLGRESIDRGVAAASVGLAIVVAFMLVYYKGAGINAIVALALNLVIVMGVMAMLEATLTLPGIAGMILLIGMAVDANVLIFERIREEINLGKTVRSAINTGFAKAFSAIVDANITTLVAAVFLFQFGTGPVKGFAVTLVIGILASMFTAVFVSRVLFDLWTLLRPRSLSI